ncbi:MAG: winged helix-turn-helix transcriptional regulator [Chloroflexi bacterium]|nr:winged helix-turn-helix transcriptional regulator [Chloroflexota bacterium]
MDETLQALAEPRRRDILRLVFGREMKAGDIAAHFAVTRPAISQHIQVLRRAGLLDERREGTCRYYRARPEGLADLRRFIEEFWDYRLQLLKAEAEKEERRVRRHARSRG